MVVVLEEDVAQRRQAKTHSPSGAHVALVPRVDEKTGIDLLPYDEDRRDSSFLCKHAFSGWQAETCPHSNPHPTSSSTFLPTTQQNPSSVPGIAPQHPAYGLPLPCRLLGDQKSHPKADQYSELQNFLLWCRGPNPPWGQWLGPPGKEHLAQSCLGRSHGWHQ